MRRTFTLPGISVHSGRPCDQRRAKSAPSASAYAASSRATIGGSSAGARSSRASASTCASKSDGDRRAQRQRVDVHVRQAPQIVERQRRQRRGQRAQLVRRRVQPPALVGRADDEHAHVALARRRDRGQVVLEEVVGVQVHVVEAIRADGVDEQARRRVRREADVADAPGAAELLRHLPAAAGAQGQLDAVGCVQPVERQQIDGVHAQQRERLLQLAWRTAPDSRGGAASSAARRRCAGGAPAPCRTAASLVP